MFYFLAAILLIIAVSFILCPLCGQISRNSRSTVTAVDSSLRISTNITLYRDQLDDLTQVFAQGGIDKAEYQQLKAELARNLLSDSKDNNHCSVLEKAVASEAGTAELVNQELQQRPWLIGSIFIGGLLILPLLAVVIYQYLGVNEADWQIAERLQYKNELLQQPQLINQSVVEEINRELIEKLENSIEKSPNNIQVNLLRARIAVELRAFDKAIESYQRALEQQPQSSQVMAQIMAELAQTLFISAGSRAKPAIDMLSTKVLSIDPDNITALSLMGMAAFESEQYGEAIEFWQRALALLQPNTTDAKTLRQSVVQARARLAMQKERSQQ